MRSEVLNPSRSFALKCTLAFLFFRFSFVHEFLSAFLHFDTHILIILGVVAYFAWFVAGDMFAAFSERLAWIWVAFVACMCIAMVTSIWRGGSLNVVMPYVRTTFPLLLLIPAVITTSGDVKKILNTLGFAGTVTTLFGLLHRSYEQGRMDIGSEGSSIQDPNDYAAHLIFLLPAIAYFLFAKERSVFVKVFGVGVIGAALIEIMSTGSRGGFVALIATALYVALTGSPKIRAFLLLGVPLIGLLALPLVPQQSRDRLMSIFNSKDQSESAAASADARRALLIDSLKATAAHPLFGVGPGTFAIYQAGTAAEVGQKGMWHETHNGYTQISSECGIPAALLLLSAMFMTFRSLRRASKSAVTDIAAASRTLAIMVVSFAFTLIFLAQGYRFTMLAVSAITIGIIRVTTFKTEAAQPEPSGF